MPSPSFDDTRVPIPDVEFDKHQRLAFEKEMLGLYVSDHPLMGFEAALRRSTECTIAELHEAADGEVTLVGGVITNLIRKYTRKGDLMATFVLEDLQASITAWVFPRTMQELGWVLADDAVVIVKGRLDQRDDETKLVVLDIRREELKQRRGRGPGGPAPAGHPQRHAWSRSSSRSSSPTRAAGR